jgi:outer membrane protein assembly factor BamB
MTHRCANNTRETISMNNKLKQITVLLAFSVLLLPLFAKDWPQQGGPNRDGVAPAATAGKLASSFPDQKVPLLWQTNVGLGTAPPVASGGRLYTFGLFKPGADPERLAEPSSSPNYEEIAILSPYMGEKQTKGKAIKLHEIPGTPDWVIKEFGNFFDYIYRGDEYAQCLDATTGKVIWATRLTDWGVAYTANAGWVMASPAIASGKIIFHSPAGHLYCLNLSDGKKLWEVNLWEHEMYSWAEKQSNACGPLVINDTVIVSYVGVNDARYKQITTGQRQTDWTYPLLILGGFDLQTGKRKWLCKPDKGGFRLMNCRIGYAVIENNPTVLVPFGAGTYGVDPATGAKRWEYELVDDKDVVKGRRGLWAPYGSYAPVAWNNYVIDSVSNAHDDIDSRTWCIQITDSKPKLAWESNEFVPFTEVFKSNLVLCDGKVYGFDAHGVWDLPGVPSEERSKIDRWKNQPGRNKRDKSIGQFQCRDVATGKLLWSTDAMQAHFPPHDWRSQIVNGPSEWYPTKLILHADLLIAYSLSDLWIGQLKKDGLDILANGPGYGNVDGSEPVLVDGLLYVRKLSTGDGNLSCYDLRTK